MPIDGLVNTKWMAGAIGLGLFVWLGRTHAVCLDIEALLRRPGLTVADRPDVADSHPPGRPNVLAGAAATAHRHVPRFALGRSAASTVGN